MDHSVRRINALAHALGAQQYLEIGVQKGDTFRGVNIAKKIGVDPHFRFDPDELRNENTLLVSSESDAFFYSHHDGRLFDIIFIDGLHQFEQVVRDLSNAIVYSHQRTVFILDDTKPSGVFSAMPDLGDAIRFRRQFGESREAWHGDVYKAVAYVHDFWPSLNYKTIVGSGNPQTLMWKSNKSPRKPLLNDLERISRMTFFDLLKNVDLLKECSEDEAIGLCVAELIDSRDGSQ